MIIPAAGRGSRLRADIPKVLFPVNGRPMVDYLLDRYAPFVDRFVLVVHPEAAEAIRAYCAARPERIEYAFQPSPTGMLDAIMIPHRIVRGFGPGDVWITWCDQVAVRAGTAAALAEWARREPEAAASLPTLVRPEPYIHFERDAAGTICRVLHRREGDTMPAEGEGDLGLFRLSANGYFRLLPEFAREAVVSPVTRERNFLPFLAWLAGRAPVRTFTGATEIESVGINSPDDLRRIEAYLRHGA
jgi:bifunctional UDP-N-acetylglucosamine pyrophosphorylase/glucosamine-1-phosphate N-acetyltransferase